MAALLAGSLLVGSLLLAPALTHACTLKLGPRSGEFSLNPSGDQSLMVFDSSSGDTLPPNPAELRDVQTLLVRDPEESDGVTCTDLDELTFKVDGIDDRTEVKDLYLAAFISSSQSGVFLTNTPTTYLRFDPGAAASRTVTIALGDAKHRSRDGEPFRYRQAFCFAIALVDEAGNMGPRSLGQCLNTVNPYDPTVRMIEKHPGGCSSASGLTAWLALATVTALRRRRPTA